MQLKKLAIEDINTLQKICLEAYTLNFKDHWTKNGLELYLEKEFSNERLHQDLNNKSIGYYYITVDEKPVGFLKVNYTSSKKLSEIENCELEKIYILPKFKGKGLGKAVMHQVITEARNQNKKLLFLCVIDTNSSAIAFYETLGFKFHSKTRLDAPHFKEELKGMNRMCLEL